MNVVCRVSVVEKWSTSGRKLGAALLPFDALLRVARLQTMQKSVAIRLAFFLGLFLFV